MEKVGAVSYGLNLPPGTKLHNVFHVSQLKLRLSASVQLESVFPISPTRIISSSYNTADGRSETSNAWRDLEIHKGEHQTKCLGTLVRKSDSDEATWDNSERLQLNFAEFITDLENMVDSKEGSSVRG